MAHAHDDHHDEPGAGPKVLARSDRHPRVRTIQVDRPEQRDTTYVAASA